MAWLELHQSVRDHRKIVEVAESLDMPEPHVVGHLTYLWLWAIDNAPDGVLPASPRVIARAAWWTGDPLAFLAAVVGAGLIDQSGDLLTIHDWETYTGKLIGQREANRQRQQRHRDRNRANRNDDVPANDGVTVTSPSRNGATEQNSTQHNTTQQDPVAAVREPAREGQPGDPPPAPQRPPIPPRRQTEMPIPDDFRLTDEMRGFALTLGVTEAEAVAEFGKMVAFAEANDLRKRDWEGYWRWWLQQGVSKGHCGPKARSTGNVRQFSARAPASTAQERTKAAFDEIFAEIDGEPPPGNEGDWETIETRGVVR